MSEDPDVRRLVAAARRYRVAAHAFRAALAAYDECRTAATRERTVAARVALDAAQDALFAAAEASDDAVVLLPGTAADPAATGEREADPRPSHLQLRPWDHQPQP